MDTAVIARALHVLAVIYWIGGLSFVTLVVLPLARSQAVGEEAQKLFVAIERHFSAQARISVPLAGITGLWMTYSLDLWERFIDPHFWWLPAMFGLWLIFMLMLFLIEPRLHGKFQEMARREPRRAFRRVSRLHEVLLALAGVTAFGAVVGSHGFDFF